MMKKYDVSIIVPCFNVEKYIDRCMSSIINQTYGFDKIEVILVNDASTDKTLEMITEYENKYENVKIISYDQNMRQGGARNRGIKKATGKWISFVDADDWIASDMYEVLFCEQHDEFDMVHGSFKPMSIFDNPKSVTNGIYHLKFDGENGRKHLKSIPAKLEHKLGIIPMILKRSIVIDNEIYFPERLAYEDNFWMNILFLYINDVYFIDRDIYCYFQNPNSTVGSKNSNHQLDRLTTWEMLIDEYKRRGVLELYKDDYLNQTIQTYYLNSWFVFYKTLDELPDTFIRMISLFENNFSYYRTYIRNNFDNYCYFDKLILLPLIFPSINDDGKYFEKVKELYFYESKFIEPNELSIDVVKKILSESSREDFENTLNEYEVLLYRMSVNGYNKCVLTQALIDIIKSVALSDEMLVVASWLLVCISKKEQHLLFLTNVLESCEKICKGDMYEKIRRLEYLYSISE